MVEMILDGALAAPGDEDELLDARRPRLLDRVLDQRLVDDRQHLLRHRLGRRQEARAEAADREDRLADGSRHAMPLSLTNEWARPAAARACGPGLFCHSARDRASRLTATMPGRFAAGSPMAEQDFLGLG
jgi:hypothetical protein